MKFKALIFDINGTLVDIHTDENRQEIYKTISELLNTYGIHLTPEEFRTLFYDLMKAQRKEKNQEHAEFDVIEIFRTLITDYATPELKKISAAKVYCLPEFLAQTFRATSMIHLATFPQVHEVLTQLQKDYTLGIISDAQKLWEEAELRRLNLTQYFQVTVISSEIGIRKPAEYIFNYALAKLQLRPQDVIYIGNDKYRDIYGANRLGIKTVYFQSGTPEPSYHNANPDYIIYNFSELPTAVEFLEKQN